MSEFFLDGFESEVKVSVPDDITKDQLLSFRPFTTWKDTLRKSLALQHSDLKHPFREAPYSLKRVTIQSVDFFGPNHIGFVKLEAEVRNAANKSLPGIAFLRGGSVAMLMILRPSDTNNERYVVLTEQPRLPAGSLRFMEIPAGMMDKDDNFKSKAVEEIKEETGLVVKTAELINLTELALEEGEDMEGHNTEGLQLAMYPSPGGSDEFITIFLWEKVLERQEIEDMKGSLTGLRKRGEMITVNILNYEDLYKVGARDAKTLAAWSLYESLKRAKHPKLRSEPVEIAGVLTRSQLKRSATYGLDVAK